MGKKNLDKELIFINISDIYIISKLLLSYNFSDEALFKNIIRMSKINSELINKSRDYIDKLKHKLKHKKFPDYELKAIDIKTYKEL